MMAKGIEVALYELRVRHCCDCDQRVSPLEIHEYIVEQLMAAKIDLSEANRLLTQCRNPGKVIEIFEDDADYESDKATLTRGRR
jgi:hypothetical protein